MYLCEACGVWPPDDVKESAACGPMTSGGAGSLEFLGSGTSRGSTGSGTLARKSVCCNLTGGINQLDTVTRRMINRQAQTNNARLAAASARLIDGDIHYVPRGVTIFADRCCRPPFGKTRLIPTRREDVGNRRNRRHVPGPPAHVYKQVASPRSRHARHGRACLRFRSTNDASLLQPEIASNRYQPKFRDISVASMTPSRGAEGISAYAYDVGVKTCVARCGVGWDISYTPHLFFII